MAYFKVVVYAELDRAESAMDITWSNLFDKVSDGFDRDLIAAAEACSEQYFQPLSDLLTGGGSLRCLRAETLESVVPRLTASFCNAIPELSQHPGFIEEFNPQDKELYREARLTVRFSMYFQCIVTAYDAEMACYVSKLLMLEQLRLACLREKGPMTGELSLYLMRDFGLLHEDIVAMDADPPAK
ncbi:hypothetical protein IT575_07120 [bacterium]|nr:hypothetical protein [bacterium]